MIRKVLEGLLFLQLPHPCHVPPLWGESLRRTLRLDPFDQRMNLEVRAAYQEQGMSSSPQVVEGNSQGTIYVAKVTNMMCLR